MALLSEDENYQNQQQQQQQYLYNNRIPVPSINSDFFIYRLDAQQILDDLKNMLAGRSYDQEKQQYVDMFERRVNSKGINMILNIVYAHGLNKTITLGCLTHDEIYDRVRRMAKSLAKILAFNYSYYGIKKMYRESLFWEIIDVVHSGLSRSEEGREADQLSTASQRMEVRSIDRGQREPSPFNPARLFGRRER